MVTWKRGLSDWEKSADRRITALENDNRALQVDNEALHKSLDSILDLLKEAPAEEEKMPERIKTPRPLTITDRKRKLIESRSDPSFINRMIAEKDASEKKDEGPKSA
jgi:hypothetical protein